MMTAMSLLGLVFLMLLGGGIIAGALNMQKLIGWENRALTSLADAVRNIRMEFEDEQRLVEASEAVSVWPARESAPPAQQGNRAA